MTLSAEGYPLAGVRLDYIGERRVAADDTPRETTLRGYNIVAWTKGGVAYWAISDLNMGELRELQARL